MPSYTEKNKQANEKAKLSLTSGSFNFEMPRSPWTTKNRDKVQMNFTSWIPLESNEKNWGGEIGQSLASKKDLI